MTTLVVGVSGSLCGGLCRRLVAQGYAVRALFLSPLTEQQQTTFTRLGVEIMTHTDPTPIPWMQVMHGIDNVVTTACCLVAHQPGDSVMPLSYQDQVNLISAAQRAHVDQFVYLSFSCAIDQGDDPSPLTASTRAVEDCVRSSGLNFTILRPACLMESWLSPSAGFDYEHARARIYGLGTKRVSFLAMQDLVELVVMALGNPSAYNITLDVGGPEALSQYDVVHIFEEVSGRSFMMHHVTMEALQAERAHAVAPREKSLAAVRQTIAQGDEIAMRDVLKLFPVEMTTVRDYAKRVLVG